MKKKPLPKIKPNTRPSTLLRYARQVLIDRGWIQGKFAEVEEADDFSYKYNDGAVCSVGAVNLVTTGNPDRSPEYGDALQQVRQIAILRLQSVIQRNVPTWNDDSARTKRQVLNAFAKAARLAEKEERKAERERAKARRGLAAA